MIAADELIDQLTRIGVQEYTGVPCSFLTPFIDRLATRADIGYVPATHEGEALAIAAGSWLAGVTTGVFAQNSGLGNMVNPLTSLTFPSRIPVPLIVTWRGEPGIGDEPQHELMGAITEQLLSATETHYAVLPADPAQLEGILRGAVSHMRDQRLPFALLVRRGSIGAHRHPLREPIPATRPAGRLDRDAAGQRGQAPRRINAIESVLSSVPESAAVISTTGKTSRELFTLADRPQHFYLVGAMGSASAVGIGVSRHTERMTVILDGDGAALMRLGTLPTAGSFASGHLVHVVLDNRVHDSTGGQYTLSRGIDFPSVAIACGYQNVVGCLDLASFEQALRMAASRIGPTLLHLRVRPGSIPQLGRPTIHPSEIALRFREFVTSSSMKNRKVS